LLKPHGVFVVTVLAGILVVTPTAGQQFSLRRGVIRSPVFLAFFYVAWALLARALSGEYQLNPVGEFYSGVAESSLQPGLFAAVLPVFLTYLQAHFSVVVFFGGVFLAPLLLAWFDRDAADERRRVLLALSLFAIGVTVALILVTAKFSSDIAGRGAYDSAERLHGRYYEYALPALWLCGFGALRLSPMPWKLQSRLFVGLIQMALVIAATTLFAKWPVAYYSDFPLAFAGRASWMLFSTLSAVACVVCVAACLFRRGLDGVYLYTLAAVLLFGGSAVSERQRGDASGQPAPDQLGLAMRALLNEQERTHTLIVSPDLAAGVFRLGYYLLPRPRIELAPAGKSAGCGLIPAEVGDVVTFSGISLECGLTLQLSHGDMRWYRR
jgi:phosphoglycerol transferase